MNIIIVGLGNPGKKYEMTRHNLGFIVLDNFKAEYQLDDFRMVKRFDALISVWNQKEKKAVFTKPETFMNSSGKTILKLAKKYLPEEKKEGKFKNLLVVHDDVDLEVGKIKVVKGKGSAGHNGIESIIENLLTKNFFRLRIGIKPEGEKKIVDMEKFVLEEFSEGEKEKIERGINLAVEAVNFFIFNGGEATMNKFNSQNEPTS